MRQILLTILLLSTSTILYCQKTGKLISKPVTELEDKLDKRDLVLKKVAVGQSFSENSKTYRMWTDSQMIEVTESNDSLYYGQIVSFIFRIKRKTEGTVKLLYVADGLSKSDAKDIFKKVRDLDYIPTSDSVKGFVYFLDGNFYGIDKLIGGQLMRKNYNDLFEQEAIDFGPIKELFKQLNEDFLKTRYKTLHSLMPSGTYKYISGTIIIRKM